MAAEDDTSMCVKNENVATTSEEVPPHLDFLSPDFDPLEALQTEGLQPPNARVRPLDNLNRCRHILPQEVPESVVNISPKSRSAESIEAQERAKARTSLLLEKAAEKARQVKIFDMLAEKAKGPLSFLSVCYNEKGRVQVWTRHTHGIRGNLIGFLHAFDRHMNMILQDVEEVYTVRRHVPRLVNKRGRRSKIPKDESNNECSSGVVENSDLVTINAEGNENSSKAIDEITEGLKELRLFPKLEHRRRHVGQVFLRGDSVVMVRRIQ
ncbi:hypothetical protein SUGI_0845700 [Cryptomeria japonica]|uniref:uncharacterized protein LOC131034967 n=1 Tax=Cryptomeria japonica TaxID=3369 RepID=UPI002414737C|nr:uncharacterized protein LOC131034967 [Cryptomeria japonica]GLJ40881.1 hypothetical protein SUGI_0845700 [Cryptomeria japonica]